MGYVHSQNEAAIWYFGRNAGLDFNSGTPVALTDGALRTPEGCAAISDFNGNLLFYTDGITIWDRSHIPMPNGSGLTGHPSSTQSGIIVPFPGDPDLYYVFSVDELGNPNGLQYSIVNMTLDGGLGDVSIKNQFLEAPVTEKLSAVAHANGSDIWVMAHRLGSNDFVAYLATATGLNTTPVVSSIGATYASASDSGGYLKFSPDGSLLALASTGDGGVQLFSFDNASGIVSNLIDLTPFYTSLSPTSFLLDAYGVEFSSDSSKLYITSINYSSGGIQDNELYQFDVSTLNAISVINSATLISKQVIPMFAIQLAIDGKIYVTQSDERYLGAINNPNVQGQGCGYNDNVVFLGTGVGLLGLPPFIQTYFIVGLQARNFCLGDNTEFTLTTNEPVVSISWDFGDGGTSTLENPSHMYAAPGTYTVSVTATTASETKTESKDITIYETPVANATSDFELCRTTANHEFDLSTKDTEVLGAQSVADHTINYYPTLTDAENGTNPLPMLYTNTNATETIFARISNINNPSCFDTTSFNLLVKDSPVFNTVTDWVACDTDGDGFFGFDLLQKDGEVLNGQDSTTFSVSYHVTQADADGDLNPLPTNYTNSLATETIYFRIENVTYPECYETGSFQLEVIRQVMANTPLDLEYCDDDNDGQAVFDLTQAEPEIIGTQNASSLLVSYHDSQTDANANLNPLSPTYYLSTSYQKTIFIRVSNVTDTSCYDTTSFQLNIFDTPVVPTVSDWLVCDDDNDGQYLFDLSEKSNEIFAIAMGASLSYYETQQDAEMGQNGIGGTYQNISNPQTIHYRLENSNNHDCFVIGTFELQVFDTPVANQPTDVIACDINETGIQTLDLSFKDAEVLNGQDPTLYSVSYFENQTDADANQNPLNKQSYSNSAMRETLYARIQNIVNEACYNTTSFGLMINALPQPNLEETYVICPDSPDLLIDGGTFETYEWQDATGTILGSDSTFEVRELGDYTLTVTQTTNGISCERTVSFEVVSSGAPETFAVDINGFSDQVEVVIHATGIGEFEYSLDGAVYQSDNEFVVLSGEYTVYVRDLYECRTLTEDIFVLGYQKFFTPNGDGRNEYWSIIGAERYPESLLYIFDRYGKLLQQIPPDGIGWDGTYNGKQLPSSDYWFRYVYDGGKVFSGHFSLKR